MQSLLTAVAALLLAAGPAIAQVDPKIAKQCQPAADFAGCVKAFTTPAVVVDEIQPLRNAMKQVAERLTAGTSLRDSSATYQPVLDQLALVEMKHGSDQTVIAARRATDMFGTTQSAWDIRIRAAVTGRGFPSNAYHCDILKKTADNFNEKYGTTNPWAFSSAVMGRLFGLSICTVPAGQLPEDFMYQKVVQTLKEGSVTKEVRMTYTAATLKMMQSAGSAFTPADPFNPANFRR